MLSINISEKDGRPVCNSLLLGSVEGKKTVTSGYSTLTGKGGSILNNIKVWKTVLSITWNFLKLLPQLEVLPGNSRCIKHWVIALN